jgi:hypothetical protein
MGFVLKSFFLPWHQTRMCSQPRVGQWIVAVKPLHLVLWKYIDQQVWFLSFGLIEMYTYLINNNIFT